jgi:transcriptional regulator with XRE-family HTH domain
MQRARLGSELRQVRRLAGLSGQEMGRQVGVSQKTVSRIENGETVPSLPQVTAWARAAKVPTDRRAILAALAEAAVNEVSVFRERLAGGLAAVQVSVRESEADSRTIRNFQLGIVPGLLQTAEYARRILALADINGSGDHEAAAVIRLERQQILHERGRRFEFLMTEAALRWRPGPAEVLRSQLLQVASIASLENVDIGVIPADVEMHAIPRCSFILHEDRDDDQPAVAFVETPHAALYATEPSDVEIYRGELARFRESAVHGDDAIEFVRALAV